MRILIPTDRGSLTMLAVSWHVPDPESLKPPGTVGTNCHEYPKRSSVTSSTPKVPSSRTSVLPTGEVNWNSDLPPVPTTISRSPCARSTPPLGSWRA